MRTRGVTRSRVVSAHPPERGAWRPLVSGEISTSMSSSSQGEIGVGNVRGGNRDALFADRTIHLRERPSRERERLAALAMQDVPSHDLRTADHPRLPRELILQLLDRHDLHAHHGVERVGDVDERLQPWIAFAGFEPGNRWLVRSEFGRELFLADATASPEANDRLGEVERRERKERPPVRERTTALDLARDRIGDTPRYPRQFDRRGDSRF